MDYNILKDQLKDIENYIPNIPEFPKFKFKGRGIVICAGGANYNRSAFLTVYALQHIFKSKLPIEWYYNGRSEMPEEFEKEIYQNISNIRLIDASLIKHIQGGEQITNLEKYKIKPFALLVSGFEEILYIDSDCVPIKDPEYLFESEEYKKWG